MDIQKSFDTTCKVIFGEELGPLSDFAPYLEEFMLPYKIGKSSISGKPVMISGAFYPKGAKFVSADEIGSLKFAPLNVNEIKDIDSLLSAVQERVLYCGNKAFGKCMDVSEADNCTDCVNVHHAQNCFNIKNSAYVSSHRDSECAFGAIGFPDSHFIIRTMEGINANRCFESYYAANISDTYYAFNCLSCQNCIFAFSLRSKRNVIGNLQLSKGDYAALSKKLISEMAEILKRDKRIFSIADLALFGREKGAALIDVPATDSPVPKKVEAAFSSTAKLLLGKERPMLRSYSNWLQNSGIVRIKNVMGAFGPVCRTEGLPIVEKIPADRLVSLSEIPLVSEKTIRLSPGEQPPLSEIASRVSKCAYFAMELVDGQNDECVDTPIVYNGSNVYKLWDTTHSKLSAYSTAVVESQYIFGGSLKAFKSEFCINSYEPVDVKRGFETDSCSFSRDAYFCHNCENVDNAILCFNAKALRYAVGNTEVGKEEFARVKKILLDYINKELDSKHATSISIFSISKKAAKKI